VTLQNKAKPKTEDYGEEMRVKMLTLRLKKEETEHQEDICKDAEEGVQTLLTALLSRRTSVLKGNSES
jgi:hypothetical protein